MMTLKSYVRILFLSILCFTSESALSNASQTNASQTLKLTENDVINLISTQSLDYQELKNNILSAEFSYEVLNSDYRLNLNFDYSLEKDQLESTSTFLNADSENTRKSLLLNKRFKTGTETSLELAQIDSTSNSSEYTQNYYTLSLEQNIFPYIVSNSEGSALLAAEKDMQLAQLQTEINLLDKTREVLNLYWRVQASQKSVQENEDLLTRYERLVANVKRKKQNSYANAGEVEQALAEYETRKQTWLEDRNTLMTNLLLLKTALNIPADQNIELVSPKVSTKELPPKFQGEVKNLRRYHVQKLRTESAVNDSNSASWKNSPQVSVYGEYTGQGLDPDKKESWNELQRDPSDQYILGVKLNYYFDNDLNEKEKQLKNATKEIELTRLNRAEQDLKLQVENARAKLENAYNNLQTTQNVVKYRTEAVKQLTVTYGQGRTDISFLIDAFNKKIQAEVAAINAQGAYSTTLIEYRNLIY